MKHKDWLNPDHIILSNKKTNSLYKQFTRHMRSREFEELRLLENKSEFYIRYFFNGISYWYFANILQKKSKDYYIELDFVLPDSTTELEKKYIRLNREEKLSKLLK